jgi:hypothetical protein
VPAAFGHVSAPERLLTWQRAVYALLEQGYVPDLINESAGYVSAKRREDLQADALTGSTAIVVIAPDGVVRVEVSGVGIATSQEGATSQIAQRQMELLNAVLGRPQPAPKS